MSSTPIDSVFYIIPVLSVSCQANAAVGHLLVISNTQTHLNDLILWSKTRRFSCMTLNSGRTTSKHNCMTHTGRGLWYADTVGCHSLGVGGAYDTQTQLDVTHLGRAGPMIRRHSWMSLTWGGRGLWYTDTVGCHSLGVGGAYDTQTQMDVTHLGWAGPMVRRCIWMSLA